MAEYLESGQIDGISDVAASPLSVWVPSGQADGVSTVAVGAPRKTKLPVGQADVVSTVAGGNPWISSTGRINNVSTVTASPMYVFHPGASSAGITITATSAEPKRIAFANATVDAQASISVPTLSAKFAMTGVIDGIASVTNGGFLVKRPSGSADLLTDVSGSVLHTQKSSGQADGISQSSINGVPRRVFMVYGSARFLSDATTSIDGTLWDGEGEGMKLGEILDEVDTLIPNSLPTAMKVTWINHIQNQLFRDYPVPDKVASFTTNLLQDTYAFPPDCPVDRVQHLVVDGQEYEFRDWIEPTVNRFDSYDRYWTALAGKLVICPIPRDKVEVSIYYRPRPAHLIESDLTATPTFPEDFHELLVFGCAIRTAKASAQTAQLATLYEIEYRELVEKADLVLVRRRQAKTNIATRWM